MKKVLLASTVLALSATVAAAEVSVSGSARMGLVYDGGKVGPADSKVLFTSRVRVAFSMSGETDGGLSFGASVRNDQSGQGNTTNGDSKVFISGTFGTLTFGDNDSAANALVGHVAQISLTDLGSTQELGYLGQSKTSVLYEYSAGALSFAASVGQRNIAGKAAVPATFTPAVAAIADEAMSVAVKYKADTFSAALGYEDTKTDSQVSVALGASFSGVDLKLVAMDRKLATDMGWAISAGYKMDALGVTAFYADNNKNARDAYGIGASYNLGGGATLVGGIAKESGRKAVADLGVSMSF